MHKVLAGSVYIQGTPVTPLLLNYGVMEIKGQAPALQEPAV